MLYTFEDVPEDLPRPPLAAMRALLSAGALLSPKGWLALSVDARRTLAREGAEAQVNLRVVQALVQTAHVSELRLVPRLVEPPSSEVPLEVARAIGPLRRIESSEWRRLRPLDRYVIATLTHNNRLFFRAVQEIFPETAPSDGDSWRALVAHCEVRLRADVIELVKSPRFLDGRAFVLARAAGIRAARRGAETFDLRAESTVGPIELDWGPSDDPDVLVWQAHVSAWDGAFFPAASLSAAVVAAVALCDMVARQDPDASIRCAQIAQKPWLVGKDYFGEGATAFYPGKRKELRDVAPGGVTVPLPLARQPLHGGGDRAGTSAPPPSMHGGHAHGALLPPSPGPPGSRFDALQPAHAARGPAGSSASAELDPVVLPGVRPVSTVLLWAILGLLILLVVAVAGVIVIVVR